MQSDGRVHFRCSHCDKRMVINAQRAGERLKCPGCGQSIQVPGDPPAPPPKPAAAAPKPAAAPAPAPRSTPVEQYEYMEVNRPAGDGLCSDDSCPCGYPGATIPRGGGYLYISQEVVDFRKDCKSIATAQARVQSMFGGMALFGPGVLAPILMCEQGARKRGIDLQVAADDARHWWQTGMAPLRPTPRAH